MIRRYGPIATSRGEQIDGAVRGEVQRRDGGCVGRRAGLPGDCQWSLGLDHVRASHGMGMKSPSTADNLVTLCGSHHRWKTEHGREARPLLLAYLERFEDPHAACVDPCSSLCPAGGSR